MVILAALRYLPRLTESEVGLTIVKELLEIPCIQISHFVYIHVYYVHEFKTYLRKNHLLKMTS